MAKETKEAKEKEEEALKVEVMPPPAKDLKGSFKTFEEMISYLQNKFYGVSKLGLEFCWEVGYEANLIIEASVYGENTVDTFVEKLALPGLDTKQTYKYAQFARMYTRKELKDLLGKDHIGWGVVSRLIRVKDKDTRLMLENKVSKGEIPPSKLDDEITKLIEEGDEGKETKGKKAEKPENPLKNVKRSFAKATELAHIIKSHSLEVIKAIETVAGEMDDTDKCEDELAALAEMQEAIQEMVEELNEVLEECKKIK